MSRRGFLNSPAAWLILLPPLLMLKLVSSSPPRPDPAFFLPAETYFLAEGETAALVRLYGRIEGICPAVRREVRGRAGFVLEQIGRFFPRLGLALLPDSDGKERAILLLPDGILPRLLAGLAALGGREPAVFQAGGCLAVAFEPVSPAGLGLPVQPEASLGETRFYRRFQESISPRPSAWLYLSPAAVPSAGKILDPALVRNLGRLGDFAALELSWDQGGSLRARLGKSEGVFPAAAFPPGGDAPVSLVFRRPAEILERLGPILPARLSTLGEFYAVEGGKLEIRRLLEAFPFPLAEAALSLRFSGEEAVRQFSGRLTREAAGAGLPVSRRLLPGGDFTVATIFPGYSPGWTISGRELKAVFPLSASLLDAPAPGPSAPPGLEAVISLDSFDAEVAPALGALFAQISPSWGRGFQTGRKLAAALAGPESRYRLSLVLGEGGILLELAAP